MSGYQIDPKDQVISILTEAEDFAAFANNAEVRALLPSLAPAQISSIKNRAVMRFQANHAVIAADFDAWLSRLKAEAKRAVALTLDDETRDRIAAEVGEWARNLPLNAKRTWLAGTTSVLDAIIANSCKAHFNCRTLSYEYRERPPWRTKRAHRADGPAFNDVDWHRCRAWISRELHLEFASRAITDSMVAHARERTFDPVQRWLRRELPEWDGVERMSKLFARYFGAEDNEYSGLVSRRFLLSLIARALQPGCKQEEVVVVHAKQGAKKTTGFEALLGEYVLSQPVHVDDETILKYNYALLIEWGELDGLSQRRVESIKRFLSEGFTMIRIKYDRLPRKILKRYAICATVNEKAYLVDKTGNRRWIPLDVGVTTPRVDTKGLARDRNQIFAEAMIAYNGGERWWLDPNDAADAVAEARASAELEDTWDAVIARWVKPQIKEHGFVRLESILTRALKIPEERHNEATTKRVCQILRKLGYDNRRQRNGRSSLRVWRPARS